VNPHWQNQAACRFVDDPDLFFPEAPHGGSRADYLQQIKKAKRICWGCPVRIDCFEYARAYKTEDGIWGGVEFKRSAKRHKEEAA